MNIGLIDVDGHNFPNFALMRASAYHKAKGDQVEWATPFNRYDKVLASKVFTFTPDFNYMTLQADIIEKGGPVMIFIRSFHLKYLVAHSWIIPFIHNIIFLFSSFQEAVSGNAHFVWFGKKRATSGPSTL
mgnify:CR=1 FL=1|jgi:hypothetical protein